MASPGLADPVADAQAVFRRLLDAMAHPGRIVPLDGFEALAEGGVCGTSMAVMLSLLDYETPLWLEPNRHEGPVAATMRLHAGCPFTASPDDAAFALVTEPEAMPALADFAQGTADYPDRSTTLLLQVTRLGCGERFRLMGPGIESVTVLAVEGLPRGFLEAWRGNEGRFPQGVDVVLLDAARLAALPRTVRMEAG